ncbi:hypothetical protein RA280_37560 [Cupriavidus sp. CV2]|nr:hypothetical protein [Cupriavidus sp. CV2]MDW3687344.1 hypothetical protein [Cupriavidus sp. CV2]
MRVVTRDGENAVAGDIGELWFRGAGVCAGYMGGAAGADGFDAQGWLHSGDLPFAALLARGGVGMAPIAAYARHSSFPKR